MLRFLTMLVLVPREQPGLEEHVSMLVVFKKLFHLTAQYCDNEQDALQVGFAESHRRPDWDTMVTNISNYIRSLNFKYRGSLMDEDVEYGFALFLILDI